MNVVLVHGWGSLYPNRVYSKLKLELENKGYRVCVFSYNFRKSIQESSESLKNFLRERDISSCNFVGMSMGNTVIRYFTSENNFNCDKFVAICPPFNKPKLLNLLRPRWLAKRIVGEGLIQIVDDKSIRKPLPNTKLGIITGYKKLARTPVFFAYTLINQMYLVFRKGKNDGLMLESEALPTDLDFKHVSADYNHMDYPDSSEMIKQISSFLHNGKFLK